MAVKRNFSLAIVDIERIAEINSIVTQYTNNLKQYSTYFYFSIDPIRVDDVKMDITLFDLEAENESGLDKKLTDLVESLNQLNTEYAIRDEDTHEMIVEIEHVIAFHIKFDNMAHIKQGTYEKIDELNHLKTEFGICKTYNPNFRAIENVSIENKAIEPEIVYLFSDSAENLSKLKEVIFEKIRDIDSDFVIDVKPFMFID